MNIYLRFCGIMLGKIFPGKTVSSFLGVGYLPTWQNYWASFLALFIIDITLVLTYGNQYLLYTPSSWLPVAAVFIEVVLFTSVIQIIGIFILQSRDPAANSGENIVIQMATGQMLTVGCSMPAIMYIYITISKFYLSICKQILQCPAWFNDFMHFLFFITIPFVFFNIVEIVKPWPISTIQLGYNNPLSITIEGIVYALYSIILLYLVAFVFCDLTMPFAIEFNTMVAKYVQRDLFTFKEGLSALKAGSALK
ncbi:MAG: phosphatidylglycerophosphatase [Wolbachia endosymbiont of Tyrophagus putrescentiae]|nr:phosphatidylglycerophosphatase [Wolbachia endosymbiont of Tyrophagus putrescentiae]